MLDQNLGAPRWLTTSLLCSYFGEESRAARVTVEIGFLDYSVDPLSIVLQVPMIDGGDVDACSETGGPTDYRRDRLDDSEDEAGAEGFAEARAMEDRAFAERRGEGIGRHAERKDDDSE